MGEMAMIFFKKKRKYKYTLHSDCEFETGMEVSHPKDLGLLAIDAVGKLMIRKGYSWDGPSGPTIDTRNAMQGSLIHDALYQLMREEVLPQSLRKRADEILREVCMEDGMSKVRASCLYRAVRMAGASAAKPDLLQAPVSRM